MGQNFAFSRLKSTPLLVLAVNNMSYVWNITIQYKFNLKRYKARKWREKLKEQKKEEKNNKHLGVP